MPASVDQPLHPGASANLVARWRAGPGEIVQPLHGQRRGHPAIIPGGLRSELIAVVRRTHSLPHDLFNVKTRVACDTACAIFDLPHPDAPRGRTA